MMYKKESEETTFDVNLMIYVKALDFTCITKLCFALLSYQKCNGITAA